MPGFLLSFPSLCHFNSNYGPDDGVIGKGFTSANHFSETKDGRVLAGASFGFIYFNPNKIAEKQPPPAVTITGLIIFDTPVSLDSVLCKERKLQLTYKQNFITVQYASISYLSPKETVYYYQLDGVDKDWVRAGNQRFATYTYLKGGNYIFKVKCENRNGIFSPPTTILSIAIDPPFWETWWFKISCLLLAVCCVYLFIAYRVNQIKKLSLVRSEISRDLHDEIGSTLSGVSLFSEMAKAKLSDHQIEQVNEILAKIDESSREMLEKMSDIVWAINPKNDNFAKVIERIKNFSANTARSVGIFLHFDTDEALLLANLGMEYRRNIYMICKDAINNAAKYANCRNLTVDFRKGENEINISILDDGTGFDLQQFNDGNGIPNMNARAKEIGAKLKMRSEKGKGTLVRLSFKITQMR
jgi:two-component sensor histidine kinase